MERWLNKRKIALFTLFHLNKNLLLRIVCNVQIQMFLVVFHWFSFLHFDIQSSVLSESYDLLMTHNNNKGDTHLVAWQPHHPYSFKWHLSIWGKQKAFQKNHYYNFHVPVSPFHSWKFLKNPWSKSKVMRMCIFCPKMANLPKRRDFSEKPLIQFWCTS